MKTSSIGAMPSAIALSTVRKRPSCRCRSARKPAIARTNSSFPNSDGWNWSGPMSIQRFEPRTASANAYTITISASAVPYTTRQ